MDCTDGSDELICEYFKESGICPAWKVCCENGDAVHFSYRCNGYSDCGRPQSINDTTADEANCQNIKEYIEMFSL
ncbi:hypothetical protein B566_EDAN007557 [Ephemera danica]|nr:hypothetical protein B566_EDAN007557 [Ephemera danica]